jgi:NADH-quinone oxidoreductase subunit B
MPLNLEPADRLPLRRDERALDDPQEGKGFIVHSVRGFIKEMTAGLFSWSQKSSIWPLTFGIKCCAIEMMAFGAARYDSDRMGVFFRASPRQADLLIIAGPATIKLKDVILQLYEQMPEPKYVIAFGECAICGGPFWDSYSVINGVDKLIPVDVYVPGCPPRPEQLLLAIQKLQEIIDERSTGMKRGRTEVVGMPAKSREELLAEIMAHPTYVMGHQTGQPRFAPTPDELFAATPTGQPEETRPKKPVAPPVAATQAAAPQPTSSLSAPEVRQ